MKKYLYIFSFFYFSLLAADTQQSFWELYTTALRGDKIAQYQVGVMYEQGNGIEQNQSLAAHWFEESAKQGFVDAQYNIAIMYASGRGVRADEGLAMMWLSRAAKQKDHEARKLLLKIIDGELDSDKQEDDKGNSVPTSEEILTITPMLLYTNENASVCSSDNMCTEYKKKMIFTTISKRGEYYKINGIIDKKGWKKYPKEGWIHEDSIDHKK
ncbi:MAG: sel1 repeat family protein [Sulfuricurvum sp.]|uniref:tetratricopeptide repeat protein n=1 Tax=Sulfuricurvum sp. TaxID=2025608 RepID=UPI0025F60769|nr:tetratricopeptide repeat protein [Sulfuricurvum sp.]MBV5321173.1 sel1 repeat family protein [Sulfuricurvum sp.]